MELNKTSGLNQQPSLRMAALIAGLGVLIMAFTVPVVEFYIFPKLIDNNNPANTVHTITLNIPLFTTAIFIHFITVICDVIVAWALYIFLAPVNRNFALLTAWFRLVYTAFNIVALLNLVQILSLLNTSEAWIPDQIQDYVLLNIHSFHMQWRLGLIFFGIYLLLLGFLVLKAPYIPKLIGILLIIAAIGYITDDLKYFFFPGIDTGFLWFTFFGELIFMFWLLIKGTRLQLNQQLP